MFAISQPAIPQFWRLATTLGLCCDGAVSCEPEWAWPISMLPSCLKALLASRPALLSLAPPEVAAGWTGLWAPRCLLGALHRCLWTGTWAMRYTGCRCWLSSPGALFGLATRVLVSLTPLRRSAFWPRLVGFLRCSSHLCWCVRYFPTAGFSGWDAESSTLRFGLGCGLGSSASPPVSEASISSSATVGNHE